MLQSYTIHPHCARHPGAQDKIKSPPKGTTRTTNHPQGRTRQGTQHNDRHEQTRGHPKDNTSTGYPQRSYHRPAHPQMYRLHGHQGSNSQGIHTRHFVPLPATKMRSHPPPSVDINPIDDDKWTQNHASGAATAPSATKNIVLRWRKQLMYKYYLSP